MKRFLIILGVLLGLAITSGWEYQGFPDDSDPPGQELAQVDAFSDATFEKSGIQTLVVKALMVERHIAFEYSFAENQPIRIANVKMKAILKHPTEKDLFYKQDIQRSRSQTVMRC